MNEFEQNVQSKRNDAIDSGVGFIVSFGFFATLFIIATIIKCIGS
ncbi:yqzM-like family protein [Bacillus pseudomycoides]|nr:YqzM family protein [Bacillus pseudomycoides]AIK37496.1 yqzM-like family protein [Bacillus pseudomycoides]AJI16715.1 yqzM-like family protein [Bacillus pseudomycoides]